MATKLQVRRDTAANWTSADTVLSQGEFGWETDTGYMKIGDGTTAWSSLAYFTPSGADDNTTYDLAAAAGGGGAVVSLTGSDATSDDVTFSAGTRITVTPVGNVITFDVDQDLANYDNTTSAFITQSAFGTTSIDALSDVSTAGASTGAHLEYDGANWSTAATDFSTTKYFLGGLATNRFIEYRNAVITIGAISSGDPVDFPTDLGADAGMEWEVNNPGTDFVANITPGPVNINRSQYFRIIIDNTTGATKGSISGIQRNGVTQTVNWTNGALPVVSGDDVYDIYEFYCFRGDGGSDETWYGTLLTNGFSGTIATLSDVDVTANSGPVNGYLLAYNSSTSKWENTNQIENKINYRNGLSTSGQGVTETMHMYDTPLTITEGDDVTFALTAGVYGNSGKWVIEDVDNNFTADITGVDSVTSVYNKWIIAVNNNVSPGVGMTALKIDGVAKTINWAGGKPPVTEPGRFDVYEIERWKETGELGDEYIFVRHWNDNSGGTFDGDLTGSVYGDDSTVLVDGLQNKINLDKTVMGDIAIEKAVTGTGEIFGSLIAETASNEYNKITFKTGPDTFADNGEVTWSTRVQGSLTEIFEIKGSTVGKSGLTINPQNNAEVDTYIAGGSDAFLVVVDAGLDKVGIGKVPTQGKLDVNGDLYATTVRGSIIATPGIAPATAGEAGETGEIRMDNNYLYGKTPGGDWKRIAWTSI